MTVLVVLPVALPLTVAGLSVLAARRSWLQRLLSVATLGTVFAATLVLLVRVDREGPQTVQIGGWAPPFGITLVADRLAALLLTVSAFVLLAVLLYALGQGIADRGRVAIFHPVYLVLAAGVALSFLTGDLFNLFVAFEVMLVASYVLLTLGGSRPQVRSGMTYVVVSLTSSVLLVSTVGLVYAATGTVNFADLAGRLADVPDGVRLALGTLLLVVFGVKAAVFPLYFWLPDSYPTAPAPVTAVFAGLLTKVGVYAIIRTQTLLFPGDGAPSLLLLALAASTMIVGILGAIAQDDVKRLLSFTIVGHIGYMLFGLGLYTVAGLAGAIFYTVHHIVVQTTLFLVSGLMERRVGTASLHRLGGLLHLTPVIAVLFFLPAMSLAGIPPLSGFLGKVALLRAGVEVGSVAAYVLVAAAVLTSLLTLYAMVVVWRRAFWGSPQRPEPDRDPEDLVEVATRRTPRLMIGATAVVVAGGVALTPLAGPLYALSTRAADDLLGRTPYRAAVLSDTVPTDTISPDAVPPNAGNRIGDERIADDATEADP